MDSFAGTNRRRAPRVPVDLQLDYFADDCQLYTFATNLSDGGVFVQSKAPEPPGSMLELRLTVPEEPEPIQLQGEVVWFKTMPVGEGPGMGVRFVNLDRQRKRRITSLLKRIQRESRQN